MRMPHRLLRLAAPLTLLAASAAAAPTHTRVVEEAGAFRLLRDGTPYAIRGVGGTGRLGQLAAAGGNSIRTWGVDGSTRALLDEAHALGLSVTVGLWMRHERHGFSYDDPAAVRAQQDAMLADVRSLMDHPAVLMWGVGNEVEQPGNRPAVYRAINAAAAAIKALDPHHPTMAVLAELGPGGVKAEAVRSLCPAIDVVGVNAYGGILSVGERFAAAGVGKPYVVTEHGPPGHWEAPRTAWGTPIEPSSTRKAALYRRGHEAAVLGHPGLCLGGYAFLWGHKQEATATWYGMFLPGGGRTAAVDAMRELWTGQPPADRAPTLRSLTLDGPADAAAGARITATLDAADPEGGPLRVRWVLRAASAGDGVGGDAEAANPDVPGAVVAASAASATVRLPERPGAYRLFAYAHDAAGGAAVANVPIRVRADADRD